MLPFTISRGELSMHFSRLTFHLKLRSRFCLSLIVVFSLASLGFEVHLPRDLQRTDKFNEFWGSLRRLCWCCCDGSGWCWGLFEYPGHSLKLSCKSSKVPVSRVSSKEGGVQIWSLKMNDVGTWQLNMCSTLKCWWMLKLKRNLHHMRQNYHFLLVLPHRNFPNTRPEVGLNCFCSRCYNSA